MQNLANDLLLRNAEPVTTEEDSTMQYDNGISHFSYKYKKSLRNFLHTITFTINLVAGLVFKSHDHICKAWRLFISLFFITLTTISHAEIALQTDHPNQYEVQKGDTLWSISSRFLKNPWQWQLLWQHNPQITYPHDLFVGDRLELHDQSGHPWMSVTHVTRLSPKIRLDQKDAPIPTVPIEKIAPFLNQARVFMENAFKKAPYIVAIGGEHVIGAAGEEIYVNGFNQASASQQPAIYTVYRPAKEYRDPKTKEFLGYLGTYIAKANLVNSGKPATFSLIDSEQEMLIGDRVFPGDSQVATQNFTLHAPARPVSGQIIDVLGEGLTQLGQYQSVVINKGSDDGVTPGAVLSIYQSGRQVLDSVANPEKPKVVLLPDVLAGQLFVYRTYSHVSFGLIMVATRNMHVMDKVSNPQYS